MNTAFRFVLLLVLSLAIPVYGLAGLAAPQDQCPMESGSTSFVGIDGVADDHHANAGSSDGADCCSDPGAFDETGQSCKPGQECPTVHAVHVPVLLAWVTRLVGIEGTSPVNLLPPSGSPSSIWRPPAL